MQEQIGTGKIQVLTQVQKRKGVGKGPSPVLFQALLFLGSSVAALWGGVGLAHGIGNSSILPTAPNQINLIYSLSLVSTFCGKLDIKCTHY